MKKLFYLIQVSLVALMFSSAAMADDDDWGRGGWGGHGHHGWGGHHGHGWGHHHGHHHGHRGWGGRQVNNYYQQPPVAYYQPQPQYYPPQPVYNGGGYYDNRSHQGLAGGVVGTVFGYELGNGHPLAAGLGAAAGSFLGNGVGWRY